jgi:auxin responsive GH3 family protein
LLHYIQVGFHIVFIHVYFVGLYPYKVGDIILVTSFYNRAPQFEFVYLRNVVFSIDTDKTNEEDLLKDITKAKELLEQFNARLSKYTSFVDTSTLPNHYVLLWFYNDFANYIMFQGIIKLLSLILISTFYFTESMGKYQ